MICTQACPTALVHSPRELYLRALEQEHEEILFEAYNQRNTLKQQRARDRDAATSSPGASSSKPAPATYSSPIDLAACSGIDWSAAAHYDHRGRQLDFKETIRQRQARLEFLRRQEFARRLALKGLNDSAASAYAIKRLPPPRARPAERVNAAIKIQRVFRAHLAVRYALGDLAHLHQHLRSVRAAFSPKLSFLAAAPASSAPESSPRWRAKQLDNALTVREYSDALHLVLLELASFGKALVAASASASSSTPSASASRSGAGAGARRGTHMRAAEHPRVLAATRALAADLRAEMDRLDRAKVDVWVRDQREQHTRLSDVRVDVLEAIEESDSEGEGEGEADMELDSDADSVLDEEDVPSLASDVSGESDSDEQEEDDDDDAVTGSQAAALAAIFAVASARRAKKSGATAGNGAGRGNGHGHGHGHQRTRSISSLSSASVSALSLNLPLSLSPSSSGSSLSSSSSSISSRRSRVSRRPSLGSISEVDEA